MATMPIQIVQVTGFGDALDVLQDDGGHFRQTLGDHHITLRQDEDLSSILLHSPTFQRFQIENLTHQAVNQGEEATEFQPRCLFLYCHEAMRMKLVAMEILVSTISPK